MNRELVYLSGTMGLYGACKLTTGHGQQPSVGQIRRSQLASAIKRAALLHI